MTEELVDNSVRDQFFKELRANGQNNFCLDCEKKNPRWTSVHLGIHLCIDCAGKHRQFGVMYSFVKSTNLDGWTKKQLLYMERGGNSRALEYFKKCGIITPTNKHIDYKSAIVQKYKSLLTDEVESFMSNKTVPVPAKEPEPVVTVEIEKKESKKESNIENKAVEVEEVQPLQIKGKKKKGAKRITDDIDFGNFDDGISQVEREKMVKVSQPVPEVKAVSSSGETPIFQAPKIQDPKEMEEQAAKEALEKLKQKDNIKAISSESFKDMNINSAVLQQNLSKFSGSTAISSSAFFGQEEPKQQTMDKIKGALSSAGQKIYGKLSSLTSYLSKSTQQ